MRILCLFAFQVPRASGKSSRRDVSHGNVVQKTVLRVGETTRRLTQTTRRVGATARDGLQQVVGGLSRLKIEVPSAGPTAYRAIQDTTYGHQEIMVN